MNYGYFDKEKREYVITNPRTPSPWMNYLGNGGFGGLISQCGGGLTFDRDPSNRRITRYRFQGTPQDNSGRYLYIRDEETGDYFTPTWQPTGRDMQHYECRHGFSYTTISGQYMDILSSTTYFVPIDKPYEIWNTTVTNKSDRIRRLKIFSYAEISFPGAQIDQLCHWSSMEFKTYFENGRLIIDTGLNDKLKTNPYGEALIDYMATSLPVVGFDTDASKFIGLYNSVKNPDALIRGYCENSLIEADSPVAVLCSEITLAPNESKEFCHILGGATSIESIDKLVEEALCDSKTALSEINAKWDNVLGAMQVKTPDEDMNLMLNSWHTYQAKTTFDWSRFISFYERGIDRGFGFRDSMQDVLGIMYLEPEKARERIELLLSIQCSNGNARSVYFPATRSSEGGGRSDDHLWSILSVCNYIRETGNLQFLFKKLPYADGGEGTVIEHLERGMDFTMNNLGAHGIPSFLSSDWDDSLWWINQKGGAESAFVFFQLGHAAKELIELYKFACLPENAAKMQKIYDYCLSKVDVLWDGKWYIRAFTGDGEKYCTDDDQYNKMHLIPQAWAVMSGLASEEKANTAMDYVMKHLYTDKGLKTHYMPNDTRDPKDKSFYSFPAGVRENGGIFFHSNTWVIIAYAMLGRGDDAFKCYRASLPSRRNDISDLTVTEPYVYSQTMIAPPSSNAYKCVNSWLTGTASWMHYAATQYILGVRPEYAGLRIEPQIPTDWDGFKMSKTIRGTKCNIEYKASGSRLTVNGKELDGNIIPWDSFGGDALEIKYE